MIDLKSEYRKPEPYEAHEDLLPLAEILENHPIAQAFVFPSDEDVARRRGGWVFHAWESKGYPGYYHCAFFAPDGRLVNSDAPILGSHHLCRMLLTFVHQCDASFDLAKVNWHPCSWDEFTMYESITATQEPWWRE